MYMQYLCIIQAFLDILPFVKVTFNDTFISQLREILVYVSVINVYKGEILLIVKTVR